MEYMKLALELAEKGRGFTNPNPVVGAVIVKDGRIIGQGYHERYGQLHAERNALASCIEDPEGSDMYVTLEPCCHYGKTPPCTEAIINNKIRRVYVGSTDPNPLVAGKGISILRAAGIEVAEGVMKEECDLANEVFFHFIRTGMPYVTLKYAMTADGKIATGSGRSKWITGNEARKRVHMMRHENAAIMVGMGTVRADDPMLDCRLGSGEFGDEYKEQEFSNPVRVICDTDLSISAESKLIRTADKIRTIVAAGNDSEHYDAKKAEELVKAGAEVLPVPLCNGRTDVRAVMKQLGEEKIDSILLEGGGELAYSAMEHGLVNRIYAFIAPKIFGGKGRTPVGGSGVYDPADAFMLETRSIENVGDDIMIEYIVRK